MPRFALLISYEGTAFSGWQVQPHALTIQECLEKALSTYLRSPIKIVGSGRTDREVHAFGQVAHFDTENEFIEEKFLYSINALLPKAIRIHEVKQVEKEFHARFNAIKKTYRYLLTTDRIQPFFLANFSLILPEHCDLTLMQSAAAAFLGTHDFKTFANESSKGSAKNASVKTLFSFDLLHLRENLYFFEVTATGFLYKMVRNMMGTLLAIGKKKMPPEAIVNLFNEKDRKKLPAPAPARALFLTHVEYPKPIFDQPFKPLKMFEEWLKLS